MCTYSEGVRALGSQEGIVLGAERISVQLYYKLVAMGMTEQKARNATDITDDLLEKYPEYRPMLN